MKFLKNQFRSGSKALKSHRFVYYETPGSSEEPAHYEGGSGVKKGPIAAAILGLSLIAGGVAVERTHPGGIDGFIEDVQERVSGATETEERTISVEEAERNNTLGMLGESVGETEGFAEEREMLNAGNLNLEEHQEEFADMQVAFDLLGHNLTAENFETVVRDYQNDYNDRNTQTIGVDGEIGSETAGALINDLKAMQASLEAEPETQETPSQTTSSQAEIAPDSPSNVMQTVSEAYTPEQASYFQEDVEEYLPSPDSEAKLVIMYYDNDGNAKHGRTRHQSPSEIANLQGKVDTSRPVVIAGYSDEGNRHCTLVQLGENNQVTQVLGRNRC